MLTQGCVENTKLVMIYETLLFYMCLSTSPSEYGKHC